jgi:hypothetical protein
MDIFVGIWSRDLSAMMIYANFVANAGNTALHMQLKMTIKRSVLIMTNASDVTVV